MPGSSGTIASIQLGQTTPADTNTITTSYSYLSSPSSLWSALSTQTRGKCIKIFQQHRERVLLSFITIAIGPKRDKCLFSISVLLERGAMCAACVELEVILCSRDDPLWGCLAVREQVCSASGFHHVFQLFHLHLFPRSYLWWSKHFINHKVFSYVCCSLCISECFFQQLHIQNEVVNSCSRGYCVKSHLILTSTKELPDF